MTKNTEAILDVDTTLDTVQELQTNNHISNDTYML